MKKVSKALAPDAPVKVNEHGGKESHSPYDFTFLPPRAMFAAAEVVRYGADKYGDTFDERNHYKIPTLSHLNHAIAHIEGYLMGDKSDDHLAHALVRVMFAVDIERKELEEHNNDDIC